MPSARAALSWGLAASLALHATWLAVAPQPRAHVRRAPPAHTVELALVRVPSGASAAVSGRTFEPAQSMAAPQPSAADPANTAPSGGAVAIKQIPRASRPRPHPVEPATVSAAPPLPAAEPVGRDLSALERTLKRIAATTELSPDQRRRAMLVVLRTWEDPSRNESAEQLIDTLLRELHPGQDRAQ